MNESNPYLRLRLILIALCFLLPSLTLVPLGGLWLWQNGYAMPWAVGAAVFVGLAFAVQFYFFKQVTQENKNTVPSQASPLDATALSWTPQEEKAWSAVLAIAEATNVNDISGWDDVVALAKRTVETVARTIHPTQDDPLWKFTVPEALALIEQVSVSLRPVIADSIPFGDKLTVGQMLRVYRWRKAVGVAQKGYDIWRIIRMLNPVTAATQEFRERLSKQMYEWGREELGKRVIKGFICEVGRAAIDLYGGRLRVLPDSLNAHVSEATQQDLEKIEARKAEPLRILVAGQVNAGKSSLINALTSQMRAAADILPTTEATSAYALALNGVAEAFLLDSPGLTLDPGSSLETLAQQASQCDLILWVANATRPDRDLDLSALNAIRSYFGSNPSRRHPPLRLILSHVDRLRPLQEWSPPYNLSDTANQKAASILGAIGAVSADLSVPQQDIIPACLDRQRGLYNIDAIWAEMIQVIPEAQRAQLVRLLRDASEDWDWKRIKNQAVNAGKLLSRSIVIDRRDDKGSTNASGPSDV